MKRYVLLLLMLTFFIVLAGTVEAQAVEENLEDEITLATTIWNHDHLRMEYEYHKKSIFQAEALAALTPGGGHLYAEADEFWRWLGIGIAGLAITVRSSNEDSALHDYNNYIYLSYLVWKGLEVADARRQAERYNYQLRNELESGISASKQGVAFEARLLNYNF